MLKDLTPADYTKFREVQIRLLDSFVQICEKNNLDYWIDFGTLLGAVRHKGFIPWDDDIDVSMPIADYNKFLILANESLPLDVFLQTRQSDKGYKQNFAKLRDCYSTYLEHTENDDGGYHKGIYLDIFPSVKYPRIWPFFREALTYFTTKAWSKAVLGSQRVIIYYPIYILCKIMWFILQKFDGDEFGQTPEDNAYRYYIPNTVLRPLQKIEFFGKYYMSPNDPDKYLRIMYKDYLKLPPLDKRQGHAKYIAPDKPCNHRRSLLKSL